MRVILVASIILLRCTPSLNDVRYSAAAHTNIDRQTETRVHTVSHRVRNQIDIVKLTRNQPRKDRQTEKEREREQEHPEEKHKPMLHKHK